MSHQQSANKKRFNEDFVTIDFYMNLCLILPGMKRQGNTFVKFINYLTSLAKPIYFFPTVLPPGHKLHFYLKHVYAVHNYSYKLKLLFFQKFYQHSFSQQIQEFQNLLSNQHKLVGGDADNDWSAYTVLTREKYLAKNSLLPKVP